MFKHAKRGFTLVEVIIVVLILGILAAVAIPQFADSTQDAKLSTLQSNLAVMRNATNLYFHQHDGIYPGAVSEADGTTVPVDAAAREAAYIAQMTQYSDATGKTSTTKDPANYPYGPYVMRRVVPDQPFKVASVAADEVNCTTDAGALAVDGTPTKGWKFSVTTGELIANDAAYATE